MERTINVTIPRRHPGMAAATPAGLTPPLRSAVLPQHLHLLCRTGHAPGGASVSWTPPQLSMAPQMTAGLPIAGGPSGSWPGTFGADPYRDSRGHAPSPFSMAPHATAKLPMAASMAVAAAAEDRVTARLVQLEAALTAMKPKLEAIIANQSAAAWTMPSEASPAPVPEAVRVPVAATQRHFTQSESPKLRTPRSGGSSPLRMRRNMPQLQALNTAAKPAASSEAAGAQQPGA